MNKIKFILALCISLTLIQCDMSDFEDTNVDPNSSETADTRFLFVNASTYLEEYVGGDYNSWQVIYPHYASEYKSIQHTKFTEFDYNLGSLFYSRAIRSLNEIISMNSNDAIKGEPNVLNLGSNANQIAVARILKAFYYLHMTDAVGMIPYTEALQGSDNFFPIYDSQESIYTDLNKELSEAVDGFDDGGLNATYDILYAGNLDSWKRMANSLRMIMALRMSKVDATTGKARFADAFAHAAGYIMDNSQNFSYKFLAEEDNANPLWTNISKDKRDDYTPTDDIVDQMKNTNDPRISTYFQVNKDGNYVGVPLGISSDQVSVWNRDTLSRFGSEFTKQNAPGVLISASYINLTIAEAAERGWISANAEDFYKNGIKASMSQRTVYAGGDLTAAFDIFYAGSEIAYSGDKMTKIALQKWIANYMQDGLEAWSEWRRTGVPALGVGNSATAITELPRRLQYASDDYINNQDAYDAAIAIQGADDITTHVWWDKQ
jgi:hypothetical protein